MKKIFITLGLLLLGSCNKAKNEHIAINQTCYFENEGIVKSVLYSNHFYLLFEKLNELGTPHLKTIKRVTLNGTVTNEILSPPLETIIDFDIANDKVFALFNSNDNLHIKIFNLTGGLLEKIDIWQSKTNTTVSNFIRGKIIIKNNTIYVAFRPEDNSTRLNSINLLNLKTNWSKVIEPPQSIFGIGMNGGSYDAFEQLSHRYEVYLDVDDHENAFIAVPALYGSSLYWHNIHFSENLKHIGNTFVSIGLETDAIVTKVSPNGKRLFSVVAGSLKPDECYGIKVKDSHFFLFGRTAVPTNHIGHKWNPYLAKMNSTTGEPIYINTDSVSNSGIIFDITEDNSGNCIAVGCYDWTQNPLGFSVSESASKYISKHNKYGEIIKKIDLESDLRQNQIRSITNKNNTIWISGWEDGPGTHSGDNNNNLLYTKGFLTRIYN